MISIPETDKTVLRKLAEKKAKIGALPIQKEKAKMWACLNGLEKIRPIVWISEIPWRELGIYVQLETKDDFSQSLEIELRQDLYRWEHMLADAIIDDCIYCPLIISDTGFGIEEQGRKIVLESEYAAAKSFQPQIKEREDINKIQIPHVEFNSEATDERYELMLDIFKDILPVKKRGVLGFGLLHGMNWLPGGVFSRFLPTFLTVPKWSKKLWRGSLMPISAG